MTFNKYRGAAQGLPRRGAKRFFISLSFFLPKSDVLFQNENFLSSSSEEIKTSYIEASRRADPELASLVKNVRADDSLVSVHWGDPDESLEFFLEEQELELEKLGLDYIGYVSINRTAKLKDDDSLPQTEEEWNRLTPDIKMTYAMSALFDHLKKHYFIVEA
ncbi:MAG TPA: hypothetical protein VN132_13680 [Bdellovibrio sp.]|nr:hypothetical protein [Bdellovibrio sp.]